VLETRRMVMTTGQESAPSRQSWAAWSIRKNQTSLRAASRAMVLAFVEALRQNNEVPS